MPHIPNPMPLEVAEHKIVERTKEDPEARARQLTYLRIMGPIMRNLEATGYERRSSEVMELARVAHAVANAEAQKMKEQIEKGSIYAIETAFIAAIRQDKNLFVALNNATFQLRESKRLHKRGGKSISFIPIHINENQLRLVGNLLGMGIPPYTSIEQFLKDSAEVFAEPQTGLSFSGQRIPTSCGEGVFANIADQYGRQDSFVFNLSFSKAASEAEAALPETASRVDAMRKEIGLSLPY